MIIIPHAIIGATLTNSLASNPFLGFGLAFVSHYVLDILPHTEYKISDFLDVKTKSIKSIFNNKAAALHFLFIIADLVVAVLLCVLLFVRDEKSAWMTLLGISAGILPDVFQFLYYKFKTQPWVFLQKIHDKFHFDIKNKKLLLFHPFSQIILSLLFYLAYALTIR